MRGKHRAWIGWGTVMLVGGLWLLGCGDDEPPPSPTDAGVEDGAGDLSESEDLKEGEPEVSTDLGDQPDAATCRHNGHCDQDEYCDMEQEVCLPGCSDDNQCPAGQCNLNTHTCEDIGCTLDSDCLGPYYCEDSTSECLEGCRTNPDNCPPTQECNGNSHTCQPLGAPGCEQDDECAPNEYCQPGDPGECLVGCRQGPSNCPGGQTCNDEHECVDITGPCEQDINCPASQYCDLAQSPPACVTGCRPSPDNCPEGRLCNPSTRSCEQVCSADDECAPNSYCSSSNVCLVGCRILGPDADNCFEGHICNPESHICYDPANPCSGIACPQGEECNPLTVQCLPSQACELMGCHRDQRCDFVTHECVSLGCDPMCDTFDACAAGSCTAGVCQLDNFGGANSSADNAADILASGLFPDLTICDGEQDWYRFDLDGGDGILVTAKFYEADGDLELRFFDYTFTGDINDFVRISSTHGDDEAVAYTVAYPGPYFLVVQPSAGAIQARYSLSVKIRNYSMCTVDGDCSLERDEICLADSGRCEVRDCQSNWTCSVIEFCNPATGKCDPLPCEEDQFGGVNMNIESAVPLAPATYSDLTICNRSDDWFSVDLLENQCLQVDLLFTSLSEDDDVDIQLVTGTAEAIEVLVDAAGPGDNQSAVVNATQTGTYFIRNHHANRASYDMTFTVQDESCEIPCDPPCGPMEECNSFSGRCQPLACAPDAFGGTNTSLETAAPLTPGTSSLTICESEDDWFTLNVSAQGQCVDVTATFIESADHGDIDFDLLDPDHLPVAHGQFPGGDRERMAYDRTVAGTYLLRAFGASTLSYELTLEVSPGPCSEYPCAYHTDCVAPQLCGPSQLCEDPSCLNGGITCAINETCNQTSGQCDHTICEASSDSFGNANHSCQAAAPATPGTHASLGLCANDPDWYLLTAQPGQRVIVRATNLTANIDLYLYGLDCDIPLPLGFSMNGGTLDEAITATAPAGQDPLAPAPLWIKVTGQEEARYTLSLTVEDQ